MVKITKLKTKEELDTKGADIIKNEINSIIKEDNICTFAIPGGRSVSGIFKRLLDEDIDWTKVHIFILDERLVPITDPESNFLLAKESFLDKLLEAQKLKKENIHPFIYNPEKEHNGTKDYQEELKKIKDNFDIILLSSGEDGHIGGLYPNHHSIKDESEYFISMDDSPKPPKDRMSSSKNLLLKSKVAILLFVGESKKEPLEEFQKETTIEGFPANIVKKIEKNYILTDQD